MASKTAYYSIKKELVNHKLQENIDFIKFDEFVEQWYWDFRSKNYLREVHTSINTNCTFNCENDVYEVYTDWEIDEQLDDARTLLEEQAISEIPLRYVDFFDAEGYAESVYENVNDLFEDPVNYDGFTIVLE